MLNTETFLEIIRSSINKSTVTSTAKSRYLFSGKSSVTDAGLGSTYASVISRNIGYIKTVLLIIGGLVNHLITYPMWQMT